MGNLQELRRSVSRNKRWKRRQDKKRPKKRDKGFVIGRNDQDITEIKAPEKMQNQEEI